MFTRQQISISVKIISSPTYTTLNVHDNPLHLDVKCRRQAKSFHLFTKKISKFKIPLPYLAKVYSRSQILERPSIGGYWNKFGVPVLLENVIFTFFRCGVIQKLTILERKNGLVLSNTRVPVGPIWDLKYTFPPYLDLT